MLVGLEESPSKPADPVAFFKDMFAKDELPPLLQKRRDDAQEVVDDNARLHAQVAALTEQFDQLTKKLHEKYPASILTISNISASGVPDMDATRGSLISDPYVKFTLLEVSGDAEELQKRTNFVPNSANPVWEDVVELKLPAGSPRPPLIFARVWDNDVTKEDEAIASDEIRLTAGEEGTVEVPLKGNNEGVTLSFTFTIVAAEEAEGEAAAEEY